MATTYDPIFTTTLTSAAATVTLNSFSQGYTDLICVMGYGSNSSGGQNLYMQLNGDTTSTYSNTRVGYGGGGVGSFRDSNSTVINVGAIYNTASAYLTHITHIPNYTNTTTFKTVLVRTTSQENVFCHVGLWRATPQAVTSITFSSSGGNFQTDSTFTLYGIKAA